MSENKNDLQLKILNNLLEQVKELHKSNTKLDKKIDLGIQKLEFEIKAINKLDLEQNRILEEHIAGVNTLKKMVLDQRAHFDKRIEPLEIPSQYLHMTKNIATYVGGLAGAVWVIGRLLGWF